jgi:hypothetical protein
MEYTIEEAAERIGCAPNHLRNKVREGDVAADRKVVNGRNRYIITAEAVELERQRMAERQDKPGKGKGHGRGLGITIANRRNKQPAGELPLESPKMARQDRYLAAISTGDVATMRQIRAEMENEKEVMQSRKR